MTVYLMINSLHNHWWVQWWKNFKNRSTFGKVMGKCMVSCFLTHGVKLYRQTDTNQDSRWLSHWLTYSTT